MPQVVNPLEKVTRKLNLASNLIMRQDKPMVLTNGSWAAREKYENNSATTIVMLPAQQIGVATYLGTLKVSQRFRFAGLHDPDPVPKAAINHFDRL